MTDCNLTGFEAPRGVFSENDVLSEQASFCRLMIPRLRHRESCAEET